MKINHLAVWILVLVHQLIGWGWYTVFENMWLNLHAKTMTDIESPHDIPSHLMAIVASIVVNYALAWLISRTNAHTAGSGFAVAVICWFAFLFVEYATISMFSAFGTSPWPLILIDMGRPLLAFSISGLVLGAWRRQGASATA
jgi:hypothetical protein